MDAIDISALNTRLVPGAQRRVTYYGHIPDISEHLAKVREEFVGLPELCYVHAELIVLIRRRIDLVENVPTFLSLWAREKELLAAYLNSRWLMSACDTFTDQAPEPRRSRALAVTSIFRVLKLCETERLALRDQTLLPERYDLVAASLRAGKIFELWDGTKAYEFRTGDSFCLHIQRVLTVADKDPALGLIARTLMRRALEGDTLLARLSKLNDAFLPPECLGAEVPYEPPTLMGTKDGFNIVRIYSRYFLIPQALGPLDLEQPGALQSPEIVEVDNVGDALEEMGRIASQQDNA